MKVLAVVHVLLNRDVLDVVVVLLLAGQRQLRGLVELISVTFTRDVHHDEILSLWVELLARAIINLVRVSLVHTHVAIGLLSGVVDSDHAASVDTRATDRQPHHVLLVHLLVLGALMQVIAVSDTFAAGAMGA